MSKTSVIDRMKRKLVARALQKSRGKVTDACKLLEISRDQIYRIIDRDPDLQELLKDLRDERRGIKRYIEEEDGDEDGEDEYDSKIDEIDDL
jgi:hypothetical protein